METIISALISAGVTLLVCLYNNRQQMKHTMSQWQSEQDETRKMMEYKLDELTKKVEKHNQLIDRTYDLEKRADVQEEKIKVANHRIEDLEENARKDGAIV